MEHDEMKPDNFTQTLITRMAEAKKIAVLTGAGVSAESGVPTFRDTDGLWNKFSPSELANMSAFMRNPQLVWQWYHWRQKLIENIEPNPGHIALAELELFLKDNNQEFYLFTQNVDGLHRRAGSKNIFEMHGNIMRNKCTKCSYLTDNIDFIESELPYCPKCNSLLRPDVVWFGEMLPESVLDLAFEIADSCDVFLSIGTSALVYPAALLPVHAQDSHAYVSEINPEKTPITHLLDEFIEGKSGEILPKILLALKTFINKN